MKHIAIRSQLLLLPTSSRALLGPIDYFKPRLIAVPAAPAGGSGVTEQAITHKYCRLLIHTSVVPSQTPCRTEETTAATATATATATGTDAISAAINV